MAARQILPVPSVKRVTLYNGMTVSRDDNKNPNSLSPGEILLLLQFTKKRQQ